MVGIALIIILSICNILMPLQVSQYLRSRNWDTRVAAAHAIGSIAENVRHTSLKELLKSLEGELMEAGYSDVCKDVGVSVSDICSNPTAGLSFKRYFVISIRGPPAIGWYSASSRVGMRRCLIFPCGDEALFSHEARRGRRRLEFDVASDSSKSPAERLAHQKQNLRRRLGSITSTFLSS
ncbi:hypothetical protein GW17_00008384 [Ensete ventricosum]|nr:hypothetical protein GW17_00008384 [Ensete ventricosum]